MVIILKNKGYHEILAMTDKPLELIELAGRTAYKSQDKITEDSAIEFVKKIIKNRHESVLEHASMTVRFSFVSRGFTHEDVRHRIASFTQESTRYVDKSAFSVVIPPNMDEDAFAVDLILPSGRREVVTIKEWMELNEQTYRALRLNGWPPEDARQVLPIGIKTQIVMTANFREWRHIFKLRTSPRAHWEIRTVMSGLLQDVSRRVPAVFNDITIL